MNIITPWLRSFLPALPVDDRQLAEDLTLRGIAVEGEFPLADGGTRFEMDITTNRVDAMNHYGVAREVATIYGLELRPLSERGAAEIEAEPGDAFPVRIDESAQSLCGRFTARVLRGVSVGPATGELAAYFAALGQKPISAPVDATNYGWLAMGQPTHAFDLDKIVGGIVARRAYAGEKLMLLDGTERTLTTDDLVIADDVKALGLAGVMGGWESRVTEATTNILVEAAWFDPAAIRASSRRHLLHTDASHRFERGADFAAAPVANNLVSRLIVAQCDGRAVGPMTDVQVPALANATLDRAPVTLSFSEVRRHLGTTVDDRTDQSGNTTSPLNAELIRRTLEGLGCAVAGSSPEDASKLQGLQLRLPSWRLDLEREIDLVEEIARVFGYNRFANTLPTFTGTVIELPHNTQEQTIRNTLRALGFSEAISSTFVAEDEAATFGERSAGAVAMGNPLSAEAGYLRPSLAAGMATMIAHNIHRDVATVRLFEMGTIFTGSTAAVAERSGLALGLTGGAAASALHTAGDALLFEAKGALEALLAKFSGDVTFDAAELPAWIERGRGARALLNGKPVGVFGELSGTESARRKLRAACVLAEVNAAVLLQTPLRQPRIAELSRFQAVARDFSFVFPDTVAWASIAGSLQALDIPEMQAPTPLEIFRDPKGKSVAAGSYSLLLRTVFQSPNATLTEEQLTAWTASITAALTALGGTQRA